MNAKSAALTANGVDVLDERVTAIEFLTRHILSGWPVSSRWQMKLSLRMWQVEETARAHERPMLLNEWNEVANGERLCDLPVVRAMQDDMGHLDIWSNVALSLARVPLRRSVRYRVFSAVLNNGCNPHTLAEFLIKRGSVSHSTRATADAAGLIQKHAQGALIGSVELFGARAMRQELPGMRATVGIRDGILPGLDEHGQVVYAPEIYELEKKYGLTEEDPPSWRAPRAQRARGRWDGKGLPASKHVAYAPGMPEDQPYYEYAMLTKIAHPMSADRLGLRCVAADMRWIKHDMAICLLKGQLNMPNGAVYMARLNCLRATLATEK